MLLEVALYLTEQELAISVVEAYATPGRPRWEHARYYAGVASAEEVVAPALRSLVLRRAKDEADVSSVRARTALCGAPGAEKSAGGGAAAGGQGNRRAGRGRGEGGRGDPPPAAT